MSKDTFPYQLYLVISEAFCNKMNFLKVAEEAIHGGVDIIQLREKHLDTENYLFNALRLKAITDRNNIPLIINDNLEVAKRIDAFGIHVGNNDMPPTEIRKLWEDCQNIGYSIEYIEQLQNRETEAADYLGISPIFRTDTKINTVTEWGISGIKKIRNITDKPLVAIGNINLDNVSVVIKAGADCIAVVSAICSADNPGRAAYNLKMAITKSL